MRQGLHVMTHWYLGAFVVVMAVVVTLLFLDVDGRSESGVVPCTAKTVECWSMSRMDILIFAVIVCVLLLFASLPVSLLTLAIMTVSRVRSAMLIGTVAAFTGWLFGALVVLWIGGVGVF
jgi:hypothetical protein